MTSSAMNIDVYGENYPKEEETNNQFWMRYNLERQEDLRKKKEEQKWRAERNRVAKERQIIQQSRLAEAKRKERELKAKGDVLSQKVDEIYVQLQNLRKQHNEGTNKSIEIREKLKEISGTINQAKKLGLSSAINEQSFWKHFSNIPSHTGPVRRKVPKTSGGKKTHKKTHKTRRYTRKN